MNPWIFASPSGRGRRDAAGEGKRDRFTTLTLTLSQWATQVPYVPTLDTEIVLWQYVREWTLGW